MCESVNCLYLDIVLPEEIVLLEDLENDVSKAFVSHNTSVSEYIERNKLELLQC